MSDLLLKLGMQNEPKRQNRFIFRFPADLGIQEWTIASASRPKINIDITKVDFLNTSVYLPGRYEWDTINITLRDPIGPSSMQAVMEWVRLGAESVTGRMGYMAGFARDVTIEMLDPAGVVCEVWTLVNAWPSVVDGGQLSMSQDSVAEITMTLRPQYCILAC